MANTLKPKRSSVAGNIPTTTNLTSGEMGVNMADQKIWINNGTSVVQIGSGKVSGLADVVLSSLATGQGLSWNGTNWVNSSAGSGTVTSVSGTGTVSGLTLSGSVTGSGSLTLGGTLSLTSGQVTTALGFTPYNSTNPSGYITGSGNAATATALQTARTINGVSFNGTANITVADATKLPLSGGTLTGPLIFGNATSPNTQTIQFGDNTGWTLRYMTSVSGTPTERFRFVDTGAFNAVGAITQNGNQVLHAGNFSSYAPSLSSTYADPAWITSLASSKLTGTIDNARLNGGTYTINITGNAATVGASTSAGIQSTFVASINTTTPGTGNYGVLLTNSGGAADSAHGITWAWASSGSQAGIYVQSSGAYGTKMYLATTDSFAAGAKTAVSIDHTGAVSVLRSGLTAAAGVVSGGNNGFANATWFSGVRNPIWYFGNSTSYGISYFQGASGIGGADTIGIHPNGTPTSGGSAFSVAPSASYVNSNVVLHAGNYSSYALPLTGGTLSGVLTITSNNDNQLLLQSNDSWTGIGFNDSAVLGAEYIWHNGINGTFAIGGGGANVAGKKLHIHGGMTVGANYAATTNPTNGLNVEGAIQQAGNQVLHAGNVSSYALPLSGGDMSGRIRMGTFANSQNNTGEAWIGRASDRATGTMTVQLGNSADRVFEVVDNPWSTVIFAAGMNTFTYKGSAILHAGNVSSYAAPISHTHSYLPLSGGTLSGGLTVARKRLSFSSSYDDANHSIYNNYTNIDGEGVFDGMKMNVYDGLRIRVGNASGVTPTTVLALSSSSVRINTQLQAGQNTNGTAIIDAYGGIARYSRDNPAYGLHLDGSNYASLVNANGYVQIGPLNASHSHFQTDRPSFYFNKDVLVDGQLYRYSGNLPYLHSGNYTSYSSFSGAVTSGGNTGFRNDVYYGGVRNPIWSFGNATTYGISYFQGSAGVGGVDTIGIHPNGTATSGGSSFAIIGNGDTRAGNNSYAYAFRGHSNVAGTGEASFHPAGVYSTGTNWLYGQIITNGNTINAGGATCSLTATRANRANGNFYIDDNYGNGIVGAYASTRYQGVFAMGDSYKLPADGTSTGSLYGMAWSHPNAGGVAGNLDSHGMIVMINGGFGSCMSYSIKASGNVTANSDERLKTNWRDLPENFVSRLAKVKVGVYDRVDGEKLTQVGVSAQSFQELLPQAVVTAKDEMGTLSVSYGNAALASAVELAKDNVDLRARLAKLEALVSKLITG